MSLDDKKVIYKRRSGKTSHCHGQSARQLSNRLRSIYSTHLYTSVFTVQAIGQRILDTGLPLLYKTCTADPALHYCVASLEQKLVRVQSVLLSSRCRGGIQISQNLSQL